MSRRELRLKKEKKRQLRQEKKQRRKTSDSQRVVKRQLLLSEVDQYLLHLPYVMGAITDYSLISKLAMIECFYKDYRDRNRHLGFDDFRAMDAHFNNNIKLDPQTAIVLDHFSEADNRTTYWDFKVEETYESVATISYINDLWQRLATQIGIQYPTRPLTHRLISQP